MKNIKDFDLQDLEEEFIKMGEKKFRALQVFQWLYVEKVKSFDEMTNLSIDLRHVMIKYIVLLSLLSLIDNKL